MTNDQSNTAADLNRIVLRLRDDLSMVPQTTVELEGKQAEQVLRFLDALDDNDDVRKAYANFDISDDVMAELSA